MVRAAKRYPLVGYFLLACLWFWTSLVLDRVRAFHFWSPLVGAFAPAISAIFVTAISEGESSVRQLAQKLWRWRVNWRWYAAALGIPIAEGLLAAGIAQAAGTFRFSRISVDILRASLPALWVAFLFAAGEELGWRGFALPRLLEKYGAVRSTLIVGSLHALWHWPLILLPHQWLSDIPVVPWTAAVLADAFVFTWMIRGTGGSVLIAALFHGMTNISMVLFDGIEPRWMPWLKCGVTVAVTVILLLATGSEWVRQAGRRSKAASA